MRHRPVITLTTDFGYDDPFAGVMKGVIAGICPEAAVIDITHGIKSHDVAEAAYVLGMNYGYFPEGTVHLAVVDPGVGSKRRPILVVTGRHQFVGPDNGVFSLVFRKETGSLKVIHLTSDRYFISKTSRTFHGRDIFAPVAARLAAGEAPENFGDVINDYNVLDLPVAKRSGLSVTGEIVLIDKFGNCIANICAEDIDAHAGAEVTVSLKGRNVMIKDCYSSATDNDLHAVINSSGCLEFFVNMGSAAEIYSISVGDPVDIHFI